MEDCFENLIRGIKLLYIYKLTNTSKMIWCCQICWDIQTEYLNYIVSQYFWIDLNLSFSNGTVYFLFSYRNIENKQEYVVLTSFIIIILVSPRIEIVNACFQKLKERLKKIFQIMRELQESCNVSYWYFIKSWETLMTTSTFQK